MNQSSKTMNYADALERIRVAEHLEWEATQLRESASRRLGSLLYYGSGAAVTTAGIIAAVLYNFIGTLIVFSIILPALSFGSYITVRELSKIRATRLDSEFRQALSLDLIRPVRDTLYVIAEEESLTSSQVVALEIRLSRFNLDKNRRRRMDGED